MQMQKRDISLLVAILFVAAVLRAPITAIGPLTSVIREEFSISNAVMGMITTIPLMMFAAVAPIAGNAGVRYGAGRVIVCSMLVLLAGLLLRSYTGVFGLFFGTLFVGVGMTFGNVLIPSVIKSELPGSAGLATSLFSVTLSAFSAIAAGVSIPLCVRLGLGWRHALAVWCVPALVAAAIWAPHRQLTLRATHARAKDARSSVWRSASAWWLAAFMASQSFIFYFFLAWLPSIALSHGVSQTQSGVMATIYQLASIAGTLIAPNLAARKGAGKPVVRFVAALYFVGIQLFIFARSTAMVWAAAIICGVCTGACFSVVLLLLAIRAEDSSRSAKLSGMVQAVGYTAAAVSPTLGGHLFDVTGYWRVSLLLPLTLTLFMLLSSGKISAEEKI